MHTHQQSLVYLEDPPYNLPYNVIYNWPQSSMYVSCKGMVYGQSVTSASRSADFENHHVKISLYDRFNLHRSVLNGVHTGFPS